MKGQEALTTRDEILKAARNLFAERGFHEASMSSIAKEAGVGKGTLYWYFDSKQELFKELIKTGGKIIEDKIHKWVKEETSPEEFIKMFIETGLKHLSNNKRIIRALFSSDELGREFKRELFETRYRIINSLEMVIQQGINEGKFREVSTRHAAAAIIGIINGMTPALLCDTEDDIEELLGFSFDFIMKGLGKGD
ncbi:TetR/AcrR family transcriptional regulator [Halothermothrix orenii]|uniref:Transcriptional regulator, TetR family n=1 Tax=Halothermothrix orenii (strain H 168 / OCM 544 / DSM 9562) TaxID=373903 RepID=B8D233_HALOH|nr:TetR/AcrR family transcriptional regulator [Halothermothrix orenii]ACL69260.1 transcriptional regulator, TetR family [Halothermothrix orenii H 168]